MIKNNGLLIDNNTRLIIDKGRSKIKGIYIVRIVKIYTER